MRRLALFALLVPIVACAEGDRVPPSAKPLPAPMQGDSVVPHAPGGPQFAIVTGLDEAPVRDRAARAAFVAGFRGAFGEGQLQTVPDSDDPAAVTVPIGNRFRLLEGDVQGFDDTWQASVSFDALAPGDATVSWYAVHSSVAAVVRIAPHRARLVLRAGKGEAAPGWSEMGRQIGLLVLESLHHATGDLPDGERLRLDAERMEAPAPEAAPGRR